MPRSGKIRHRIALQSKIQTPDGAGGYSDTWQTITGLWAFIKPLRSNQSLENNKQTSTTTYDITIRYRNDVTTDMRILFEGRMFAIISAQDKDGKKQWLICNCEEHE